MKIFLPLVCMVFLMTSCSIIGEKSMVTSLEKSGSLNFSTGFTSGDITSVSYSGTENVSINFPINSHSSTILPEVLSKLSTDTKSLIELQNEKGPNVFLELNCSKYDVEGKKFCKSQQALIKKYNEETITWEEVLKKGPKYIKTFDCNKINNEYGKKYCLEYQDNIDK